MARRVHLGVRQRQVLELVAEGLGNKEIAGRMHITENTVKSHLQDVFSRLGVSSRIEALAATKIRPRRRTD
jgi:DNA-binding NarL/FixJ family response regulator